VLLLVQGGRLCHSMRLFHLCFSSFEANVTSVLGNGSVLMLRLIAEKRHNMEQVAVLWRAHNKCALRLIPVVLVLQALQLPVRQVRSASRCSRAQQYQSPSHASRTAQRYALYD
jgi:hypothetical protein